eukprot:4564408-Alexandrium_andersonii.AAC.1
MAEGYSPPAHGKGSAKKDGRGHFGVETLSLAERDYLHDHVTVRKEIEEQERRSHRLARPFSM